MSGKKSMKRKVSAEEEKVFDIAAEMNSLDLEWSEQTLTLKDFGKSLKTPQPILICEGKYKDWGQNTEDEPDLNPLLFALCKRFKFKIVAQCVNISAGKKDPIGPEFDIGDDFEGWFEIISEDGSSMFQIKSVSELAKHYDEPFVLMKSMHAHKFNDGKWEGATLDVGYEIKVGLWTFVDRGVPTCGCSMLLRCKSFSGKDVYLPVSEPGKFSRMGEDYLMGPQTVSSLCSLKFPINVQLIEGSPPPTDYEDFDRTLILRKSDFEEVLTVWPMQKDVPLVDIPTNCSMKLKTLDNLEAVRELPIYYEILRRIQTILPKGKTRPRRFQHTRTSLIRSLLQTTSSAVASHGSSTTGVQTATTATEVPPPWTSSFRTSKDIHWSKTLNLFETTKPTTTDIQLPCGFRTSTATASGPLSPSIINTQRASKSGSPSTATAYVQHSIRTSRQTTQATTDIHQPSTSGLQSSSSANAFRTSASKSVSKRPRSSKTSEESNYQHHDLAAPRRDNIRSVKMKPTETRAEQQSSRWVRRSSRIKTQQQKGNQETSGLPVAHLRRLRSEPMGDIDHQQTSGQAAVQPSRATGITPLDDTDDQQASRWVRRSLRIKTQQQKGNHETSGLPVAHLKMLRSEPMGDIDHQQTSGQTTVHQPSRATGITPLDDTDDQQTSSLSTASTSLSTDEDSPYETKSRYIDPYDEIDKIYAESKRIFSKRCNIPLEKETFL